MGRAYAHTEEAANWRTQGSHAGLAGGGSCLVLSLVPIPGGVGERDWAGEGHREGGAGGMTFAAGSSHLCGAAWLLRRLNNGEVLGGRGQTRSDHLLDPSGWGMFLDSGLVGVLKRFGPQVPDPFAAPLGRTIHCDGQLPWRQSCGTWRSLEGAGSDITRGTDHREDHREVRVP